MDTPVPSDAVTNFIGGLIAGLQSRLLDAVSLTINVPLVGSISGTLNELLANSLVGRALLNPLISAINALFTSAGPVRTALDAVSNLVSTVFGWLHDVINLRINGQNLPEDNVPGTAAMGLGPVGWVALPSGRYDVAALGVSAVENAGLLDLYLGRGSIGPSAMA